MVNASRQQLARDMAAAARREGKSVSSGGSSGGGSSSGGGGTYNPSTGIYIDSSGQGISTAFPPPGAKIIGGGEVFINGQGFSIRPEEQEAFIREKTGGRGISASSAIEQARENYKKVQETARKAREEAAKKARELAATRTQQALRDQERFRGRDPSFDKKFVIPEDVKRKIELQRIAEARVTKKTVEDFKPQPVAKGFGEFVEAVEVAVVPSLVGPKFLSSELGGVALRGTVADIQKKEKIEHINDLIKRSGSLDPRDALDKRKAALELLQLMRDKDRQNKIDQGKAEKLSKVMEESKFNLAQINADLSNKKIDQVTAIERQNKVMNRFERSGFDVEKTNGSVEITHKVFDRLSRFGGSAWTRLLKQARRGDTPIRDQALIASLDFTNKAYKAEKIYLAFQLIGVGAKAMGIFAPTITGTPAQMRLLGVSAKGAAVTIVPSYSIFKGVEMGIETGEPILAVTSALGTAAGFVGTGKIVRNIKLRNQLKAELESELNKLSPEKRAAFKEYMKQTQVLQKFEPKAKNIKLDNIESIKGKNAQNVIRDFLKQNKQKVIVGGSVAQTGQVKITRKLGDMDLYVEKGLTPEMAARNLATRLKAAGVLRVSVIRGQVTIAGKKAIEFHDISRLLTNIRQVTPTSSNPKSYIIRTPEGIRIQRVGLQASRKLVAGYADPQRFATGKYAKDLKDFKSIADQLITRAEESIRAETFIKSRKAQEFEKTFDTSIKSRFGAAVETEFGRAVKVPTTTFIKTPGVIDTTPLREPLGLIEGVGVGAVSQFGVPSQLAFTGAIIPSQVSFTAPSQVPIVPILDLGPSQVPVVKPKELFEPVVPISIVPSQPPVSKPLELFEPVVPISIVPSQPPVRKLLELFAVLPKPLKPITETKPPIILPPITPAKKVLKKLAKMKKEFEVFARIEGQDVSIGKATTKAKAKKILIKKLKKTLAASGFIEEAGRKLSVKETGLIDGEFRGSRLDIFRIVQKKGRRLGTTPETKQIQFFRKSKGGGNLFGSSNRGKNIFGF